MSLGTEHLESTKYGFDLDGIDGMSDENADDIGTTDIINNAIVQGSDQFPGHDSDFWKGTVLFRRFTKRIYLSCCTDLGQRCILMEEKSL